jgi:hypothetical protein
VKIEWDIIPSKADMEESGRLTILGSWSNNMMMVLGGKSKQPHPKVRARRLQKK